MHILDEILRSLLDFKTHAQKKDSLQIDINFYVGPKKRRGALGVKMDIIHVEELYTAITSVYKFNGKNPWDQSL